MQVIHASLKKRHRASREDMPQALNLRVNRTLSWLQRASVCEPDHDPDARFIFLWIAFNAAYGQEIASHPRISEQESFTAFLHKLHELDAHKHLDHLVWDTFSSQIRELLDNTYLFESFWSFQRGDIDEAAWLERQAAGKRKAAILLAQRHTPELLALVFQRIYTLRNQIMHGGASWHGKSNRTQVHDCATLLEHIVPVIVDIMLDHPVAAWGEACYPLITTNAP